MGITLPSYASISYRDLLYRLHLLDPEGSYMIMDAKPYYRMTETARVVCAEHGERCLSVFYIYMCQAVPCIMCKYDRANLIRKDLAIITGSAYKGYTSSNIYYEGHKEGTYENEKQLNRPLINFLKRNKR